MRLARSKRSKYALALAAAALCGATGCKSRNAVPQPDEKGYTEFADTFYSGLAGLQVGDDVRADADLGKTTKLAPGEPAGWADWGILALRQQNFDAAADRLNHAHTLAPDNGQIDYLLGLLESARGNSAAAIAHLQDAVHADPHNLRALYQLASEVERQGDAQSDARFEQLMQQVLAVQPHNVAAQLELARVAAKRGDVATLRSTLAAMEPASRSWPAEVAAQFTELQAAANGPQPRMAATRSTFLRNVLMQVPSFRNDLGDLKPQPGEGAQPLMRFLRAENAPSSPSPADTGLTFMSSGGYGGSWNWTGAIYLNGDGAPVLAYANPETVKLASGATLPFPSGSAKRAPGPESVVPLDFNYDFKNDLALAGAGGVRLFRQDDASHFTDVTAATKLPASVLNADYTGAWALDIEADGDLDLLLGNASGEPTLLRNNGDGTFAVAHPFAGVHGLQQLAWVDLNGDGNPDAAMIDGAGKLRIFLNRRSGAFAETEAPAGLGTVKAITVADTGSTGVLDVVGLEESGRIVRIAAADEGARWTVQPIAQVAPLGDEARIYAADLDNNGAVDLVISPVSGNGTPQVLLADGHGGFAAQNRQTGLARVFGIADVKNNGQLALLGLTNTGAASVSASHGTKGYHWQTIRPRAKEAHGDQRINPFGIGGEIEIRAGLLTQKQPMTSPALHFGLGTHQEAQVARILWPNGSVRAEFALKADQQVITEQRLKGSCPFLFAWDGHAMRFVKDSVPWGSAIGLRISALGSADIAATEEWYKIPRERMAPRNGAYDLRVTGELWETYFYDRLALMTVDHPAGTEVYTDERYDVPPVKLALTITHEPQPVLRAVDDTGADVTATVHDLDGNYLDNFGRGQYQGITRDHFVELTLPENLPNSSVLIAKGWLHPSDSSVNVAMGQGSGPKPQWLSMEVADGRGGWRVAQKNLGFPAGRNKICLFDLANVFRPGEPHRIRLRTNLEVYWDQIQWAERAPQTPETMQRIEASTADLHYRGFSEIHQANASSPELPDYNQLAATRPVWRDLEGYYTRFGDVRELLRATDDRYVIMNAGDEMTLRFPAPAAPRAGWVRDYVLVGDGWIKDADYNTRDSRTVLPYPYHARRNYDAPAGTLQQDVEVRNHPQDWHTYQTRYVTAEPFRAALRTHTESPATEGGTR